MKIKRLFKDLMEYLGYLAVPIIARFIFVILSFPVFKAPYQFLTDYQSAPERLRDYLKWGTRRAATLCPTLLQNLSTKKVLIIYYSKTGNTQKVAFAIGRGMKKLGLNPTIKTVSEAFGEDYYDYDLVCFGTPAYHALPPGPVMKLIKTKFAQYRKRPSEVRVPARQIPGKYALVFVTFSGVHVGVDEALPAGKLLVQEFEHLGFEVKGEWYVIGEFHGWKTGSTRGKLGDIRGRPNAEDLAGIEKKAFNLVRSLQKSCVQG